MSLLPAGYKRLEYIQSSAEGTYINLNIAPASNNLKIVADAQPTVASSANNVLWQINTSYVTSGETLQFGLFSSNWQLHMPGIFATGTTAASTVRRRIAMTAIGTNWELNGVAGSGTNTYVNTGAWRNNVITVARGNHKHYGYEIYFAGKLQRLLIPAMNASGTIGMYDAITGTFYANAGSGSYAAGPEVADADNAFKQVEYIQSSGAQYVDTGFKHNQNTRVKMDVHPTGFTENAWLFEGRNATGASGASHGIFYYYASTKVWSCDYAGTNNRVTFDTVGATDRMLVDYDKNKCTINGETKTHASTETFQSNYSLYLLADNRAGVPTGKMQAKLYSTEIYDNSTQIREYIPHVTALGTPGLLDTLNNVFYASVSATDFTAGPEIVTEWTLLEYVEADGNQYVDTLFKPNQDTRVVMDVWYTGTDTTYRWFFGCRNSSSAGMFDICTFGSATLYYDTYGSAVLKPTVTDERHVIDKSKNITYIDGKALDSFTAETFSGSYSMYLLALNNYGSVTGHNIAKLYSCTIYDNGVLLYGLKPCRLLDGRVGLVDESTGVFLESATATALIAGPDLITVPLAPEGLTANVSSGVLTLSWTASENAEGYDVYRNGDYVATTFETTFMDTINPAIAYEYGVTAYNEHGESEMSTVAVPATQKPEQVVDLRAVDSGFNYIALAWDDVAGADAYRVYRDGALLSEQADSGYSDSGLETETAYTYGVSALNEVGENAMVEITVSTTDFKLVTDRTAADVMRALELSKTLPTGNLEEWLAGMKGSYNIYDLNRVEMAVLYVIERLRIAGWYITVESKTDWKFSDFPTASEMKRYLDNIRKLRSALPAGLPAVPADMDGFTYNEANDIERLLEMLDAAVTNIMANVFYSSELYSGEVQ